MHQNAKNLSQDQVPTLKGESKYDLKAIWALCIDGDCCPWFLVNWI